MINNKIEHLSFPKLFTSFCIMILVGFASCGKSMNNQMIKPGEEILLSIEGKNIEINISNLKEGVYVGMAVGNEVVFSSNIIGDNFSYIYSKTHGSNQIKVFDSNGDGLPEYRTTKDLNSRDVHRSKVTGINWDDGRKDEIP